MQGSCQSIKAVPKMWKKAVAMNGSTKALIFIFISLAEYRPRRPTRRQSFWNPRCRFRTIGNPQPPQNLFFLFARLQYRTFLSPDFHYYPNQPQMTSPQQPEQKGVDIPLTGYKIHTMITIMSNTVMATVLPSLHQQ
ncbi:predicted protein [Histoplasma capsulatum var. duboisii H88]|uniref:Predicted protein n=1 Tax=Ajellomyces capsulatus (strain H88) TaxID=544711 RepID=F0UBR2_AJEC8|nr:predicted protein [Histoplasma capsulatum var. duboisii H88]